MSSESVLRFGDMNPIVNTHNSTNGPRRRDSPLQVDSLIERNGKEIWIKDIERLQKASSYEDRNYRIDTNWFPTQ